ncbi:MAG: DUF459 domain-containing protein [Myxococcales bacterium]|nr:DUF459 domain-containing protein [Myxococcales bacterium]
MKNKIHTLPAMLVVFITVVSTAFAEGTPTLQRPPDQPLRMLLLGSSSMKGAIGIAIERSLKGVSGIELHKVAESSTGLARPDFFDWTERARVLAKSIRPHVVILNLGPNDAQGLWTPTGWKIWGEDAWREEYQRRVLELMDLFSDARVYWIGPPAMRHENSSLRQALISVFIQSCVAQRSFARYVDTYALTCDPSGTYREEILSSNGTYVVARAGDGIHFTMTGAMIIAERVLSLVEQDLRSTISAF